MATRPSKSGKPSSAGDGGQAPPAAVPPPQVMFKITTKAEGYEVTLHHPSTGYPRAVLQDGKLYVRSASSSGDLIDNLNAAAALVERHNARQNERNDDASFCEYVDRLHSLIEAALPSSHRVALLFRNVLAEYSDISRPTRDRLNAAVAAFDALPADEKRRIFNGWHVPESRPSSSSLSGPACDFLAYRVLRIGTGGHRLFGHWDYQNDDDAGVTPVRLLITEGTSKRDVLAGLRELLDLVNDAWEPIVSFRGESMPIPAVDAFVTNDVSRFFPDPDSHLDAPMSAEKSGSSPTPNVPELGGNRNTRARTAMSAV